MKMKTKKNTTTMQLPGALALAAAGAATHSNAATVQISFANNVLTSASDANFSPDLTGDSIADIYYMSSSRSLALVAGGIGILASADALGRRYMAHVGGADAYAIRGSAVLRGLVQMTFSDNAINGAQVTGGWLDVTASSNPMGASLQINRLIFDDSSVSAPTGITAATTGLSEWSATSAVPEPSSLGLLALGAGGLLARRRRSMAA